MNEEIQNTILQTFTLLLIHYLQQKVTFHSVFHELYCVILPCICIDYLNLKNTKTSKKFEIFRLFTRPAIFANLNNLTKQFSLRSLSNRYFHIDSAVSTVV